MMKKALAGVFIFLMGQLSAVTTGKLSEMVQTTANPFPYDLHLTLFPSPVSDAEVMVAMHGMGSNYQLAEVLRPNPAIPQQIISFNFPDFGYSGTSLETTFGTVNEILPALYVWKQLVVDQGLDKLHLYGFSAGGGAIVNALATLNSTRYDSELKNIGIGVAEKQQILKAIQKGTVILEVPLKSFDEIAAQFNEPQIQMLAAIARKNGMTPIENLNQLQGLNLNIVVFFATPDQAVGNRDDKLFLDRLRSINKGQTTGIIGPTGGHISYHPELWEAYKSRL
jgi:hypothetical protein